MKTKKTTMQDIANKLNISKVSVYKALTNKQDVSEGLKKRVFNCAIKMNYKLIDPLTKNCRRVYYLIPKKFTKSTEQFYYGIFQAISKLFTNIGITVEHTIVNDDFSVKKFINNIKTYHKDDLNNFAVLWAGYIESTKLNEFLNLDVTIVCIDSYIQNSNGSFIYIDDYHAGYEITKYLIENGHKKICFVISPEVSTNMDKFFGFQKALKESNIPFTHDMHIDISLGDMHNFSKLELPDTLPTAFIFDSDLSAHNFMLTMTHQGYKIPEDFSVVGFDNTYVCEETTPKLTSIGVSNDEIASAVYKVLLKRLSSSILKPYMLFLKSNIKIRDSVSKI
ncbi:LacI family transcriptional regulator [Mycoplasmatota bacterium]|nr:LacI family transcriptional regulator [Mycoplasmatota bacterium]